ncbi:uncharacterized protein LOC116425595 [Nomia melanderi]|uniref:uncharacterized protein LOC116425595 n=1 Tax=Nomia melanderi TaxID=2448451 RepID=UPI0013043F9A|nr:uncharacterized protein LOC116425595 [Nomia melanderi]
MVSISSDSALPHSVDLESHGCLMGDKPTTPLTDSDIDKIVERKLHSNNFRVLNWSLDSLAETNGFLGSYYILTVTVKADDKSTELKFFAKTPPPIGSTQYNFLIQHNTFNKEITVYNDLIPMIGRGKGLKWVPDYYLGKNNTIIVLENAIVSGYETLNKYVPFDVEHCILTVRSLAIFHSRCLILDEKLRRSTGQTIMDYFGHVLVEVGFLENDPLARQYRYACSVAACALVDFLEDITEDQRSVLKKRISKWIEMMPKLLESSTKFRNLICHRDIWVNNILFKKDSTGKPIGCYIIDYQFIRYSPPATDFILSLYLNTSRVVRKENFDFFVDVYCDTMQSELASEGLDMQECLPRAEFVESCQQLRNMALIYCIMNLQIMLLSKEAVDKYFAGSMDGMEDVMYGDRRVELVLSQCRSMKAYQTRLIDILEEIKEHLPDNPANC